MPPRIKWSDEEKRQVWEYIYARVKDGSVKNEAPTGLKFWENYVKNTGSVRQVNALNKYYRINLRMNIAASHLSADQIDEIRVQLPIELSPVNTERLNDRRKLEDLLKIEPKEEASNTPYLENTKTERAGCLNLDPDTVQVTLTNLAVLRSTKQKNTSTRLQRNNFTGSRAFAFADPVDESGFINSQLHTPKQGQTPRVNLNRCDAKFTQSTGLFHNFKSYAPPNNLEYSLPSLGKFSRPRKRRDVFLADSSSQEFLIFSPASKRAKDNISLPKIINQATSDVNSESCPLTNANANVETPLFAFVECKPEASEIQESYDRVFEITPTKHFPLAFQMDESPTRFDAPSSSITTSDFAEKPSKLELTSVTVTPRNNNQLTPKSILKTKSHNVAHSLTPTRVTFGSCPTLNRSKSLTSLSAKSLLFSTPTANKYNHLYCKCLKAVWDNLQASRPPNTRRRMTQQDLDKVKNHTLVKDCLSRLHQISSLMACMFPAVVQPTKEPQKAALNIKGSVVMLRDAVKTVEAQPVKTPKETVGNFQESALVNNVNDFAQNTPEDVQMLEEPQSTQFINGSQISNHDTPTESQILNGTEW